MFFNVLYKLYSFTKIIEENLVKIFLSVMIGNVAIGVFFRYVLNNSLPWTEELARYLMIWFAFIGMALALKEENHVNVNFILNLFPLSIKRFIKLVAYIIVLFFLIILFSQSLNVFKVVKIQRSPAMRIPMIYPYLSVALGAILMTIELIYLIFKNLKPATKE